MALLSRQGGALLIGFLCALIGNSGIAVAQTSTLPQGWSHADVGAPVLAGNATGSGSSFTVVGAGTDIGGSSDEFQFAYQPITGDVDIRVQVSGLQNVDPAAKAGVMLREGLTDDAKDAFMYVSAGNGLAFQRRSSNGKAVETSGAAVAVPVWLRLVRQGNTFTAYSSPTGASWTQVASANINMNAQAYVGLAVTSHVASKTASATFSNVSFGSSSSGSSSSGSSSPSLPSPWATTDIGSPSLAGSASASAGTFTVTSGGQDIYNTSDQFRFVYQPVTGDTQVVAYVGSLTVTDAWAKAGVMIRADLTAPAAEATTVISGSNGWQFDRRLVPGGITYDTNGSGGTAPAWIRIVREGNLFSSYSSRDGSQWTLISTDTITMPATAYVGLAVTSHNNSAATATATFSNVTVSKPTSSNTAPTVSISAPAAGTTYTAPGSMTITATAGDTDGSITKVEFYAGSTLLGSDTSSPYSFTWNNVAAGSYSLTAVATDNGGATTKSQAVSITVGTTAKVVSNLIFAPPADYATNVTSLKVEVRRSTDATSATPLATMNLGKPAVVNGEITVDISSIVDPLAAGSYYTTVVATGPYGSTPSAPSPNFSK